jgi:hypothetical protein
MTRASIGEYTKAVRWRYLQGPKKEKGKILDEFTKVTGYHRKATIRLLNRVNQPNANRKRGRPRQYSAAVAGALRIAWEATDRLCSKRLKPFLPELIKVLRRHGDRTMTAEVEAQLCQMAHRPLTDCYAPGAGLEDGVLLALPSRAAYLRVPSLSEPLLTGRRTALVSLRLIWWPTAARVPRAFT